MELAGHRDFRWTAVTLRAEQPQDETFLFDLYASTRQEELDTWGWPAEMRQAFLAMQYKANQGRHSAFPDAEFQIVLVDSAKAGRLIVHRTREVVHLIDIALLPQFRNAGIGTALLQRLFKDAAATKRPLRLQVLKGARAGRLYQRLGFLKTSETVTHLEMEWRVPSSAL